MNNGTLSVPMVHKVLRRSYDTHDGGEFPNPERIDGDDDEYIKCMWYNFTANYFFVRVQSQIASLDGTSVNGYMQSCSFIFLRLCGCVSQLIGLLVIHSRVIGQL